MKTFRRFEYDWEERIGSFGATRTWDTGGITLYNATADERPHIPEGVGFPRVGLNAAIGNIGIQLAGPPLGFGIYQVILAGRIDALDPNLVAAAWLYDESELPNRVEVDFEATCWGDLNNPNRIHTGVFTDAERKLPMVSHPPRAFLFHRISIEARPDYSAVRYEGWRESDRKWIVPFDIDKFVVPAERVGKFRVALWRFGTPLLPGTASVAPRIAVAGFSFEAAK